MNAAPARSRSAISVLLLSAGLLVLGGCAGARTFRDRAPADTGRKGLFQRLAELEPAHSRSGRGSTAGSDETFVAAREVGGAEKLPLAWPLEKIEVTSPFGKRYGKLHEGVDLRAKRGTPVYAAGDGTVAYAGSRIGGYGRMVVIKHPAGQATVYAHNSKLLVMEGQKVTKGQKIALSGNTGHSRGPHLHFELRQGVEAVDPMAYLPPHATLVASSNPASSKPATPKRQTRQVRAKRSTEKAGVHPVADLARAPQSDRVSTSQASRKIVKKKKKTGRQPSSIARKKAKKKGRARR